MDRGALSMDEDNPPLGCNTLDTVVPMAHIFHGRKRSVPVGPSLWGKYVNHGPRFGCSEHTRIIQTDID